MDERRADAFIDYLAGTFAVDVMSVADVMSFFEDGVFLPGVGWRGYTQVWVILGDGRVGFNPERADMGVHVDLPGRALDVLRMRAGFRTDLALLSALLGLGMKVSRVDFAADDVSGVIDLDVIAAAVDAKHFTSRWRKARAEQDYASVGGEWVSGRVIRFGSRTSRAYLRMYDKRFEQLGKGHEVFVDHWVRVELELKGERAQEACYRVVAEDGLDWLGGLLRWYLDFKVPGVDKNVSRWAVCGWWLVFCGSIRTRLQRLVEQVLVTVDRVKAWIERQVAPSLAFVVAADGGDVGWLRSQIAEGRSRWSQVHLTALQAAGVV